MEQFLDKTGAWHIPILIMNAYVAVPHAWFVMSPSFMSPSKQDFWCARPPGSNFTVSEWKALNQDVNIKCQTNFGGTVQKCHSWEYNNTEHARSIQSDFNTVCDRAVFNAVHQSVLMAGLMLGNFVFSHLSDWYGRKPLLVICVVVQLLLNVATIFSPNINSLIGLTFFLATGYGGLQNIPFTQTMESVGPSKRACVSTCEEVGWIMGITIFPLCTYFLTDWRYLHASLIAPVVITLIIWCFLDESPRWLFSAGEKDKAMTLLSKIATKNKLADSDVLIKNVAQEALNSETPGKKKLSILDLFKERHIAFMALSFYVQFIVSILLYFSLIFFIVDIGRNPHLNLFISGLLEFPLIPICYYSLEKIKRKTMYTLVYIPPLITSIALAFIPSDQIIMAMVLATIGKWASQVLFTVLVVHVAECFPTKVRALAVGTSLTMSRIGAIIAPFMDRFDNISRNVICAIIVICGFLMSFLLPETSKEKLPATFVETKQKFHKSTSLTSSSSPATP